MDSITTHASAYGSVPVIVPAKRPEPPRTPTIELKGIVRSTTGRRGDLFVVFTSGPFQWSVVCRAADLQTFSRFQAIVSEQHDLWISHASQEESRATLKREEWDYAVRCAYERGDRP